MMKRLIRWLLKPCSWETSGAWGATRRVCITCGKVQERPTPAHRWYDAGHL